MGKGWGVVPYVVLCIHYYIKFGSGNEASAAAVLAAANEALKPSKHGRCRVCQDIVMILSYRIPPISFRFRDVAFEEIGLIHAYLVGVMLFAASHPRRKFSHQ